jgi:hypothetical protein
MVTEQELAALLRQHGWSLVWQSRRRQVKGFAYAKKRQGKKGISRYLIARRKLAELSPDKVLRKIGIS